MIISLGFTLHESYVRTTSQVIRHLNGGGGRASLTLISLWIVHILLRYYFPHRKLSEEGARPPHIHGDAPGVMFFLVSITYDY